MLAQVLGLLLGLILTLVFVGTGGMGLRFRLWPDNSSRQDRPGLIGMTVINSRLILSPAQLSGVSGQEDCTVYVRDYPG